MGNLDLQNTINVSIDDSLTIIRRHKLLEHKFRISLEICHQIKTISTDYKQFLLYLICPLTSKKRRKILNSIRENCYNSIGNTKSRVALNAGNASTQNIVEKEVL